ncbi:hypothetical protein F0562_023732 [Nyssa sinensis]|uniref:Uncharacterized protein n=1 Tax=Nyssa sinensis TaxID=561372 RepID=A0A5J5BJZ6_9ASTE|nr:hypothetical protein F0562_023732 [Nyssa sinensis]
MVATGGDSKEAPYVHAPGARQTHGPHPVRGGTRGEKRWARSSARFGDSNFKPDVLVRRSRDDGKVPERRTWGYQGFDHSIANTVGPAHRHVKRNGNASLGHRLKVGTRLLGLDKWRPSLAQRKGGYSGATEVSFRHSAPTATMTFRNSAPGE